MLKRLKKINKNEAIKYAVILVITFLLCQDFLQMHYAVDTYTLYDLGYMKYPTQYFLVDGRLISALVCYLGGILKLPIPVYIITLDFIGIIFIATAIYLMSKILEKIINPQKNLTKALLVLSCFVLILNQFSLEFLLFPESAVLCLGVLLNVLAIRIMVDNQKNKYLKIFYILLISAFCYQGSLNMFPVLAIMTYIVKQIVDKKDGKVKEKEFIKEMVKLAFIVIIVICISILTVKAGKILLSSEKNRMIDLTDTNTDILKERIGVSLGYLDNLWNKTMNMLPPNINTFIVISTVILLSLLKTKKEIIIKYILLVMISVAICVMLTFVFDVGLVARVNQPIAMIWGASLIILLAQAINTQKCRTTNLIYGLIIISFIINSIFIMRNISECIASSRVEENIGKTIKYAVEKYEKETGNKVTKFAYVFDENPEQYAEGIKHIGSLTERKFAYSFIVRHAMNFYCERKFKIVMMPEEIYEEKVVDKDYTEFSEDQLIFKGDSVYMIVY